MTTESKPKSNEGAPAVVYVRVSPGKGQAAKVDEPDGYSLPAQREACQRKASSLQVPLIVDEFVDRGESAKTAARAELQRLLKFVRECPPTYVVVHKIDRLARNRADDVAINLEFKTAGVHSWYRSPRTSTRLRRESWCTAS